VSGEPLIKVEDVWFSYDNEVTALRGVSLTITRGERIALIGQNGGGKTTLAKHLNGLLKPTKGRVLVKGMDTKTTPTHELVKYVGYVFQNPAHQIFTSRVYDEVAYGPKNLGLPDEEVDRRVKRALEMVGLQDYMEWHPYDLNFGQMKLLTIASILSMDPEIYVLDEPTSGQDHRWRNLVADLIMKLNQQGKTVIVITHDMKFVARTSERTILLANGKILADGPTRDVLNNIELLKEAAIKPPQITQLCHELNQRLGTRFQSMLEEEAAEEFIRHGIKA